MLIIVEITAVILIFLFVFTQVILPMVLGTIWFPFFRTSSKDVAKKIASKLDAIEAAELEQELKQLEEFEKNIRNLQ